jgi:hypothetical protein
MIINEQYELLKEEFGNKAFKRVRTKNYSSAFNDGDIESALQHNMDVMGVDDDIMSAYDIEDYKSDAHTMWEYLQDIYDDGELIDSFWCSCESNSEMLEAVEYNCARRKERASTDFNLDRAISNDIIECIIDAEWQSVRYIDGDETSMIKVEYPDGNLRYKYAPELKMKYPKHVKEEVDLNDVYRNL